MKIYLFYIRLPDDTSLYAFTDKKKYRDIFINMRNMSIFKYEKHIMTNDDYENFITRYRMCKLDEREDFKVLCTGTEYSYIIDEARYMINEELASSTLYDPNIFVTKYFKALATILYNLIYEVTSDDEAYLDEFLKPNMFHSFYVNFKHTLKKG